MATGETVWISRASLSAFRSVRRSWALCEGQKSSVMPSNDNNREREKKRSILFLSACRVFACRAVFIALFLFFFLESFKSRPFGGGGCFPTAIPLSFLLLFSGCSRSLEHIFLCLLFLCVSRRFVCFLPSFFVSYCTNQIRALKGKRKMKRETRDVNSWQLPALVEG